MILEHGFDCLPRIFPSLPFAHGMNAHQVDETGAEINTAGGSGLDHVQARFHGKGRSRHARKPGTDDHYIIYFIIRGHDSSPQVMSSSSSGNSMSSAPQ